jgi:hypothetical protein
VLVGHSPLSINSDRQMIPAVGRKHLLVSLPPCERAGANRGLFVYQRDKATRKSRDGQGSELQENQPKIARPISTKNAIEGKNFEVR